MLEVSGTWYESPWREKNYPMSHCEWCDSHFGVFCIDSGFKSMSSGFDLFLGEWQSAPSRHSKLPLDQIRTCDHLRDRMLHLQTCVHLHEIELLSGVHDEFHCPRPHIAHSLSGTNSSCTDPLSGIRMKVRLRGGRGTLFNRATIDISLTTILCMGGCG